MGELLKIDHISCTYHSLEGETLALIKNAQEKVYEDLINKVKILMT